MNKKLLQQIIKFGFVGGLSFVIDWLTGLVVLNLTMMVVSQTLATQLAAVGGFTVSIIVNYILSMKFVFERKDDMDRKAEFAVFVALSIVGMGLNSLIIFLVTGPIMNIIPFLKSMNYNLVYTGAKVTATAIVMVYNFITRKIFLEKK